MLLVGSSAEGQVLQKDDFNLAGIGCVILNMHHPTRCMAFV